MKRFESKSCEGPRGDPGDTISSRETCLDRAPGNHFLTSAVDVIKAIAHGVMKAWGF
jgi:hypothetical protein